MCIGRYTIVFLLAFASSNGFAQCDSTTLSEYHIQAHTTDNNIPFELGSHYVWFNPACTSRHTLLLHLPGTYDIPANTTYFPKLAANNGFNVICLRYPNDTSAQQPCRFSSDSSCYENFRREILEGIDYSPDINVDSSSCVYNRLLKLLQYLNAQHPSQGWNDFYSGNTINWSSIVVSGHSQGGGHAALIAKDHLVKGALTFSSPNDYSVFFNDAALWTTLPHITPDSCYFAFGNLHADIVNFSEQYLQWNDLGLGAFGDTVLVTTHNCPYNFSHQLYTTDTVSALSGNHDLPVRDAETPVDGNGVPVYLPVWKYMLRLPCVTAGISPGPETENRFMIYPNPAQGNSLHISLPENDGDAEIEIYDVEGKLIRSCSVNKPGAEIDITGLAGGIYYLQIKTESGVSEKKLVRIGN